MAIKKEETLFGLTWNALQIVLLSEKQGATECQWHTTIYVNNVYLPVWVQEISGRKHKKLSTIAASEEENWGGGGGETVFNYMLFRLCKCICYL